MCLLSLLHGIYIFQDIPVLCDSYQPPTKPGDDSIIYEDTEGVNYVFPLVHEQCVPFFDNPMDNNVEDFYHQCYTRWNLNEDMNISYWSLANEQLIDETPVWEEEAIEEPDVSSHSGFSVK